MITKSTLKKLILQIFSIHFFTNVGPSLAKKISNCDANKHRDWMNISCNNNFNTPTISEFNVL